MGLPNTDGRLKILAKKRENDNYGKCGKKDKIK